MLRHPPKLLWKLPPGVDAKILLVRRIKGLIDRLREMRVANLDRDVDQFELELEKLEQDYARYADDLMGDRMRSRHHKKTA